MGGRPRPVACPRRGRAGRLGKRDRRVRTVAIVNQKGGSGKTTTALNLGAALARAGRRTLLVDLDPQSHCALGLAIPEAHIDLQIGDAMMAHEARPLERDRLLWPVSRNLDLLPSTTRLAAVEAPRGGLADRDDRDTRLASVLARLADDYDWCLLDCPPSIGLLTFNALRAASEVLIPVETGFFALQGAAKQINTIHAVARRLNIGIPYRVLATLHNPQSPLACDILAELERRFADCLVPVIVRYDNRLREAASSGVPVIELDPASPGACDYADVAAYLVSAPAPRAAVPEPIVMPVPEGEPQGMPGMPGAHEQGSGAHPGPQAPQHATAGPDHILEPTVIIGGRPMRPAPRPASVASRAAELAERARRLSARTQEMDHRLANDPDVAAVLGDAPRLVPTPTHAPAQSPMGAPAPGSGWASIEPHIRRSLGPSVTPWGVVFTHPASPGSLVSVAGDHNGWSASTTPMRHNPATGLHEALIEMPPGRHRYRLVVDGAWITDPYNPVSESNPFGARDSVIVVPAGGVADLSPRSMMSA